MAHDLVPFRRALEYDPATGVLTWRSGARAGQESGYITQKGYRHVTVAGIEIATHRLAWALNYGAWPDGLIDHKNGDKADNRIENLRLCNHAGNAQNTVARGSERNLPKGVNRARGCVRAAYEARIGHAGRTIYLGFFYSPEAAHAAYLKAKAELHTFQPTPRASPVPTLLVEA